MTIIQNKTLKELAVEVFQIEADSILKLKERICTNAQLEICNQSRDTLMKYKDALEKSGHPLAEDIKNYTKGARCTFKDFKCTADCGFAEGKTLKRLI